MKFNKNNTCLHFLDGGDFNFLVAEPEKSMTLFEKLQFKHSIIKTLKSDGALFRADVKFISDPFITAYEKGKNKIKHLFDKEPLSDCGTLIWNAKGGTMTAFYAIESEGLGEEMDWKVVFLLFSKSTKSDLAVLDVCYLSDPDNSSLQTFMWQGFAEEGGTVTSFPAFLITFLLFTKYCDIETKIIRGSRKDKHAGVKYVNESKSDVTILDSTWFTTITRSEGFMVGDETGGFLRWQAFGPGNQQRKLIWVDPFEKEGYTRTAKVENLR